MSSAIIPGEVTLRVGDIVRLKGNRRFWGRVAWFDDHGCAVVVTIKRTDGKPVEAVDYLPGSLTAFRKSQWKKLIVQSPSTSR